MSDLFQLNDVRHKRAAKLAGFNPDNADHFQHFVRSRHLSAPSATADQW